MWEKRMIETSRGTFELFTKGEGPPLCTTHLYSEFNEKGNLLASSLADHYTVYLVNLRGSGNSTGDTTRFSLGMTDAVGDLEAVRQALNIDQWTFAGHSTGGMLALKYAIMHPESLTKIIAGGLCASSDYMRHKGSIYCPENPNNARIKEILTILGNQSSTIEERRNAGKEWTLMSLYDPKTYEMMSSRPNSGKSVASRLDYFSYKELPEFDLRKQLKETSTEAYLYSGLYDTQCPHKFSLEAATIMPNGSMTTFHFSNHYPYIEEEESFREFVAQTL
ncbi:alpha/beta fold hydrolase [Falsibacillus pallidus]|uniref:Proline iminopeptidase n=1 Tax=Falsibacillus pallidus TaxID=493781 RepID=A0A370GBR0_9BACI|nr:alpha/beta hydrolase [Falsibacillus pallidus]RDI41245.1 proline iminopeptidase [Falsibacillus pallidus]